MVSSTESERGEARAAAAANSKSRKTVQPANDVAVAAVDVESFLWCEAKFLRGSSRPMLSGRTLCKRALGDFPMSGIADLLFPLPDSLPSGEDLRELPQTSLMAEGF